MILFLISFSPFVGCRVSVVRVRRRVVVEEVEVVVVGEQSPIKGHGLIQARY